MSEHTSIANVSVKLAAPRSLYFAIFAISGFSGLIYEAIWSHYLKLFLGHAAYAQSLVLIIFMGGMAIGSWVASRYSSKLKIPILAYAIVEAIVGIGALLFHNVFTGLIDVFHTSVLPGIGIPALGITAKWLAASLLILPQSILLGMTFPLMSAGIIRRFPDTPGGSIAMLYFTNSIGAAIGVLAGGFVMIRAFGLPGTIMTAGLLNITLALVVWVLVRLDPEPETEPVRKEATTEGTELLGRLFLVAAFITGAASFIYEISWIRMLSLVLGATTHSFELMLSAFITGLAFGGLWIKRRIDRVEDPVRFSGYVQLVMGALALLTIPVYIWTFDWMAWLRNVLVHSDAAFAGFTVSSHAIALAVMLPTTFMAGMTLPMFTYVLIRNGAGEASIGRIYASNTIGAIVGVLFAVHIGLPLLGLKNLIVFGAALDIALGLILILRYAKERPSSPRFVTAGSAVAVVCAITVVGVSLDQRLLASGVYRYKNTDVAREDDLTFYRDGKTASVTFRVQPNGVGVLATNGKPDASIQLAPDKPASFDETTMVIAGALPLAYAPGAKTIANIGMGSGQTAHTVLGDPDVEVLDTVEIEVEMVRASRNFGPAVSRAYEDPRSNIHIEDAKTFFSLNGTVYDVIIAEPSNPWVSGVSSLFSREFYSAVRDYMADDGLFVQWIQTYEFTDELAISILKALSENFDDYQIYLSVNADVILVAKKEGRLPEPDWDHVLDGEVGRSLARIGIRSASDFLIRQSANRDSMIAYLEATPIQPNSDYFPYVDLNAGKALFKNTVSEMFVGWANAPAPAIEMLNGTDIAFDTLTSGTASSRIRFAEVSRWMLEKMAVTKAGDPQSGVPDGLTPKHAYMVDWLTASQQTCAANMNPDRWAESAFDIATYALHNLDPADAERLVDELRASACDVADSPLHGSMLNLYEAVANRNGKEMHSIGVGILEAELDMKEFLAGYVIDSAMLGAVTSGERDAAFDIWTRYGAAHYENAELPPIMRLVVHMAADAERGADVPSVASR